MPNNSLVMLSLRFIISSTVILPIHPIWPRSIPYFSSWVAFALNQLKLTPLQACVSTSNFRPALPVLQYPITNIDTNVISPDLTYNDNLIYHYTGGIALAALKRWKEAEEYFEICATSPGLVPAGLQMEALKKLRLVQLISTGKVSYCVKLTSSDDSLDSSWRFRSRICQNTLTLNLHDYSNPHRIGHSSMHILTTLSSFVRFTRRRNIFSSTCVYHDRIPT